MCASRTFRGAAGVLVGELEHQLVQPARPQRALLARDPALPAHNLDLPVLLLRPRVEAHRVVQPPLLALLLQAHARDARHVGVPVGRAVPWGGLLRRHWVHGAAVVHVQ